MFKTIGLSVIILAMLCANSVFIQTYSLPKSMERGKEVYTIYCQNCHMSDGNGVTGAFPPLVKTGYLKKPVKTVIEVILKGQSGEISVNNIKYNGQMPAQNYLNDEQIADVLNYIYNNWGNRSTVAVTPAQVKKMRP
jgi:nitrite reductase (NO-forming)